MRERLMTDCNPEGLVEGGWLVGWLGTLRIHLMSCKPAACMQKECSLEPP